MISLAELPKSLLRRWIFFSFMAAIGAFVWFCLMPQGFPFSHPRFWSNTPLPIGLGILALVNAYICIAKRSSLAFLLSTIPALATGLLFGCAFLYWQSLSNISGAIVFAGWLYLCVSWWFFARHLKMGSLFWISVGVSAGIGVFWASTQRSPGAATSPLLLEIPERLRPRKVSSVKTFRSGKSVLKIRPRLLFESFSPDGFWTLFTPGYRPPGKAVEYFEESEGDRITTWTQLHETNWTHLNTFSEIIISGTEPLFISFSPCPQNRVAILPSEYPTGRPARAAYLNADGIFRVVEASSGEKGPFRMLAEGAHDPSDPIELSIYNGSRLSFTVTFEDFTSQCSTDLSPTAGWGFPQNAIEFASSDATPHSAFIMLTLACTSVGRGWDSVGHSPGVYRNGVVVKIYEDGSGGRR